MKVEVRAVGLKAIREKPQRRLAHDLGTMAPTEAERDFLSLGGRSSR